MIDTVPHRIMVIKEGNHQIGREVNIQGRGTGDIWIYGGSLGGGSAPINVEGNITFIDVYSGYHDGDGVPVQQNIINVGNDDSVLNGWRSGLYAILCRQSQQHAAYHRFICGYEGI